MKTIMMTQILGICIATIGAIIIPQLAQAQVPTIVDTTPPVPQNGASTNTAAVSKLEVKCQDLKTVVRKDEQQSVLITWTTNYFGKEFTSSNRCQVVSEKLQKAANLNGGTFKGLELGIGTVNFLTVICALQNSSDKCDNDNMLFTLNPKNSANPEAVIAEMLSFTADGSGRIYEGTRSRSKKVDFSLGNWERKAFKPKKPSTTTPKRINTGF
jgi:Circadian oscillating protein COP23